MTDRAARPIAHAALAVVVLSTLAWFAVRTPLDAGFPLDDAWIHQVIARRFAAGGTLGFTAGKFGSGATSLLWPLLLAVNPLVVTLAPSTFSALVNAALYFGLCHLLLEALLADGLPTPRALVFSALFAASPNHAWFVFSGMEATLLEVLSLGAVVACCSRRRATLAGVLSALAFLTRPEAALLPVFLVLTRPARRTRRDVLGLFAPLALAAAAESLLLHRASGSFLPTTFTGRRWLWTQETPGWTALERADDTVFLWLDQLSRFTVHRGPTVFWACLGLAALGVVACVLGRLPRLTTLVGWTLLHLGVYLAVIPHIGHGGRYQPFIAGLFAPLAWLGADAVLATALARAGSALDARLTTAARGTIGALALLLLAPALDLWTRGERAAVRHVNDTEVSMGERVRALPAGAIVASFDVGGIGYFSGRPIVDLGGLADPEPIAYVRSGEIGRYLERARIDYVVVGSGFGRTFPDPWNFFLRLGLDRTPLAGTQPLASRFSTLEWWVEGFELTWHCEPGQLLYAVPGRTR